MLENNELSSLTSAEVKPRNLQNVNHLILNNKDGRYAWRPMELIHPVLYVSLVQSMTEPCHWQLIRDRLETSAGNDRINCLSLPVMSLTEEKDQAEQILHWWETVELKSIELSLDFEFILHTDIVDCYAAIYTHSIAWALHTKEVAKEKESRTDPTLTGNIIDRRIMDMHSGQTNGIPQGSVLMDLVAEVVLGYADSQLLDRIGCAGIEDFKILRYRDDYRIFVNNPHDGERILKCLSEVMGDLGMKLRPDKTSFSNEVIRSSIKEEKLHWIFRRQRDTALHRHLLILHDHSLNHTNPGSLKGALLAFSKRLEKRVKCDFPLPLIGIAVDIAYRNPKTYPFVAAILSKLISFLDNTAEKQKVLKRIKRRFSLLPHTGHMEIWLQRVCLGFESGLEYDEPLCRLLYDPETKIWNSTWISSAILLESIKSNKIVDKELVGKLSSVIPPEEVALFQFRY